MKSGSTIAIRTAALTIALAAAGADSGQVANPEPVNRFAIPSTVSPEAARALSTLYGRIKTQPKWKHPASAEDWERVNARLKAIIGPLNSKTAKELGVTTSTETLGGVPVVRIRPKGYKPGVRSLIYLHGGGYTLFSAEMLLALPAQIAAATGDEVISVEYTLAPRGNWRTVTDQVLAVWKALLASGAKANATGILGDSAGGGLAAGAVLKMRDQSLALPGALLLLSPWADLTNTGDTYSTLAAADPILNTEVLTWSAAAYADPADRKNPYVSAVYGDYAKPFPPTLIQAGTREIFVSTAVRLYQAIRAGGHEAVLDIYEGMPHVHASIIPGAPESRTAIARAAAFFDAHLAAR
jgi:epsilon-lactone hydrolase